ncbi:hypothetical protein BY996DRAFT_6410745 [Phakopsora pachyrhizi]|nr:hypothetical protein BY996DRAFT_6410745 [Phakopsora pachyrhizi]
MFSKSQKALFLAVVISLVVANPTPHVGNLLNFQVNASVAIGNNNPRQANAQQPNEQNMNQNGAINPAEIPAAQNSLAMPVDAPQDQNLISKGMGKISQAIQGGMQWLGQPFQSSKATSEQSTNSVDQDGTEDMSMLAGTGKLFQNAAVDPQPLQLQDF